MSTTIVAHPDNIRKLLNRLWQSHQLEKAPPDADLKAVSMFGILVVGNPTMPIHPTVRLELHAPPPRFIEYEKSDEDWLRYFGYIREFSYEDTSELVFYEFAADAFKPGWVNMTTAGPRGGL